MYTIRVSTNSVIFISYSFVLQFCLFLLLFFAATLIISGYIAAIYIDHYYGNKVGCKSVQHNQGNRNIVVKILHSHIRTQKLQSINLTSMTSYIEKVHRYQRGKRHEGYHLIFMQFFVHFFQ